MHVRSLIATLILLVPRALAAQDADDPLDALVEQERIRKIVESAFSDVYQARVDYRDDTAFVEAYTDIVMRLGEADPAVIPLLANEAILGDPSTFYLATYALGLQGTPEAIDPAHRLYRSYGSCSRAGHGRASRDRHALGFSAIGNALRVHRHR